jgi:RimJ/RimL family protein N-acetyltransferase
VDEASMPPVAVPGAGAVGCYFGGLLARAGAPVALIGRVLGVNRVAFVTDVRNERSRAGIAKLGAAREGVLRAHMVTQGGRVRDSVSFSIIAP